MTSSLLMAASAFKRGSLTKRNMRYFPTHKVSVYRARIYFHSWNHLGVLYAYKVFIKYFTGSDLLILSNFLVMNFWLAWNGLIIVDNYLVWVIGSKLKNLTEVKSIIWPRLDNLREGSMIYMISDCRFFKVGWFDWEHK